MLLFTAARRKAERQLTALADALAERCQGRVAPRLGRQFVSLSTPQRRGYVRARSAAVIDAALAAERGRRPNLSENRWRQLREMVVERLVRWANQLASRNLVLDYAPPARRAA